MEDSASIDSDDSSELLPPPPTTSFPEDEAEMERQESDVVETEVKISVETEDASTDIPVDVDEVLAYEQPIEATDSRDTASPVNEIIIETQTPSQAASVSTKESRKSHNPIELRLAQAVGGESHVQEKHRSPDLVPLTKNYHAFRKTLREVIGAVKAYSKATKDMHAARRKVSPFNNPKSFSAWNHLARLTHHIPFA